MFKIKEIKQFKHLSKYQQNSIIYLVSNVFGYGLSFFQTFLLAFLLKTEEFGIYTLLYAIFAFFYPVFMFGLDSSIIRYNFDKVLIKSDSELITNIVFCWIITGIFFLIIVILFFLISGKLFSKQLPFSNIFFLIISSFLYSLVFIYQNFCIAKGQSFKYGIILLLSKILITSSFIISHFVFGNIYFSSYLLNISMLILYLFIIKFLFQFRIQNFSIKKVRDILMFSYPLGINSFASFGFGHGLKIIISPLVSFEALGIYNLASQLGSTYQLIFSAITRSYLPKLYSSLENAKGELGSIRFYPKLIFKLLIITIPFFIISIYAFLSFFKKGVYFQSYYVFLLMLPGFILLIYKSYPFIFLSYLKKSNFITYSVICSLALTLLIVYYLTLKFSISGTAIGLSLGYFSQLLFLQLYVKKICSVNYLT